MDWKKSNKQARALFFILGFSLILGGCATLSSDRAVTDEDTAVLSEENTPTLSVDDADEIFPATGYADKAAKSYDNLWNRIRDGFAMEKLDSPLVARHERWFVNNPAYMERMIDRAHRYLYYIVEEVEKRGLPTEIALLPAIESAYKPLAYSRARAVGLWQFMHSTGRLYGLKINWWYDGRRDVIASTGAALDYLEKLYADFEGDWHLALAAYNAGEGKVKRKIAYNRRRGQPIDYEHLKLKRETRYYVPKLMALANIVSDPEKYGAQLAHIPNEPYFARVDTGSQIDLGVVARLTDMHIGDLHSINPGFRRWATDPNGPHHLLIPVDKKEVLIEGLNNLPENERVKYRRHKVKRGHTLYDISRRYGVSVRAIKTANRLRSNMLRIGRSLLIPVSSRPLRPVVARAPRRSRPMPMPTVEMQPIIHRVRSGETLWSIARRYKVLIRQLAEWNLINPRDVLRLGQKLKIWTSSKPSASLSRHTPAG